METKLNPFISQPLDDTTIPINAHHQVNCLDCVGTIINLDKVTLPLSNCEYVTGYIAYIESITDDVVNRGELCQ